jgi:plasmid stabilization system protein ParE
MKIVFKDSFLKRLERQIDFIASDSPKHARIFKNELLARINNIPSNPRRNRKSIYFKDNSIRDLIFKGYTVVYRINEETIEIFGLVNYQQNPTD